MGRSVSSERRLAGGLRLVIGALNHNSNVRFWVLKIGQSQNTLSTILNLNLAQIKVEIIEKYG